MVASSRSRAEVNAELAEAQHTGDIVDAGTGQKLNELYANRYPAKVAAPSRSRAEVKKELFEARRTGDIVDAGTGQKLNELYTNRYPVKKG